MKKISVSSLKVLKNEESQMVLCPICMGTGKFFTQPLKGKMVCCPTCNSVGLVSEAFLKISYYSFQKLPA